MCVVANSGSSLMPGTTLLQILIIPLCLAFQEGIILANISIDDNLYLYAYSTKKITGMCTISRGDHHVTQICELECTKAVVPQVVAQGKLHY